MSISTERFIDTASKSGVLTAAEAATLRAAAEGQLAADADTLARTLVQQGKLTRFQAAAVYQDRAESLLLGNYVILDKLGAGGMGQVFRARHRKMDRIVALKVLSKKSLASPDALPRFQREVRAAAKLTHPNIVTAHDADEAGNVHYLVMEYVEGKDLSNLVKASGPMSVPQAIDCIVQAARGFEYAHREGIVHRDVKPSNLLLDKHGVVKILDMGLARVDNPLAGPESGDGLTTSGSIMGTVDFMSPEQALDTKQADQRSDIYSLGCTFYHLLTAKKLYDGDTMMKKLLAHRQQPIPSLRAVRPETPAAVDAVYTKMVAKNPHERFQTMREMREALEAAVASRSPIAVTPKPTQAASPVAKSGSTVTPAAQRSSAVNRRLLMAGVAAVLLLAVGGWLVYGALFKTAISTETTVAATSQPEESAAVGPSTPPIEPLVAAKPSHREILPKPAADQPPTVHANGTSTASAPVASVEPSVDTTAASPSGPTPTPSQAMPAPQAATVADATPTPPNVATPTPQVVAEKPDDVPSRPAVLATPAAPAPAVATAPNVPELSPDLVCEGLRSDRVPSGLHGDNTIPFTGPKGDGRGNSRGVLAPAPSGWQRNGTQWQFSYTGFGNAYGFQIVHPWRAGQVLIMVRGPLRIIPGGAWAAVGWRAKGPGVVFQTTQYFGNALPVLDTTEHHIISQLDAQGYYRLWFDNHLVAMAVISDAQPLIFEIPPTMNPPDSPKGTSTFTGDKVPKMMSPGWAGLILAPVDGKASMRGLELSATLNPPPRFKGLVFTPGSGAPTGPTGKSVPSAPTSSAFADLGGTVVDPDTLQPIPGASAQQVAKAILKELFGDELAQAKKPDEKIALAEKLIKQSRESGGDEASQYVLLDEARSLAVDAGALSLLSRVSVQLAGIYRVDAIELLADGLDVIIARPHPVAVYKESAESALVLIDQAIAAENFELAERFSGAALAAVRKAKDTQLTKAAVDRNKSLAALKQQWDEMQKAGAVLEQTPDNPAANLVMGRYHCFVRGDWIVGFEYLAKSNDATFSQLAAKSLAVPDDLAQAAELGDAWWDAADKAKGRDKEDLRSASGYWYRHAVDTLTGLAKTRIEKRLAEIDAADGANSTGKPKPPSRPTSGPTVGATPPKSRTAAGSRTVDVMSMINPARDAIRGAWAIRGSALVCEKGAVLQLPVEPAGDYVLSFELTRLTPKTDPTDYFGLGLPVGEHDAYLAFEEPTTGLGLIDGKPAKENETTIRDFQLPVNTPVAVQCEVRKDGVKVVAGGRTLFDWKGESSRLRRGAGWAGDEQKKIYLKAKSPFAIRMIRLTAL